MLADTGGDFTYFKKIYNRFFAFIYGWSLFAVIQTATISSLAYVFAQSLNSIVPLPELFKSMNIFTIGGVFYPLQDFGIKLTGILLILVLTLLNISGLKSGGWSQPCHSPACGSRAHYHCGLWLGQQH
jgi:APA family basic amino acid/polyamine antiporter